MKNFTFFKGIIPLFAVLITFVQASSQNAPIGCSGQFFVSHGTAGTSTSTTSVEKLTFSGSTITTSGFSTNPTGIGYNALGLNPIDGYMYGLRYPASGQKVRLVRIGNGTPNNVVDLGLISSADISNGDVAYAGCFDADGTYYFITNNDEFFKITGNNYPASSLTANKISNVSPTNFFVDIAIDPTDGQMYGVSFDQVVYKVNKTSGVLTSIGTHAGTQYIAALFFDEVGGLFGYRQDGTFQKINKTNATLTQVGTADTYTYADGCSCSFGRVFHDLSSQKGICPTVPNPNPVFNITAAITNQTSSQKTGLTFTLDIPGNRFSFNQTPATILANLQGVGVLPPAATTANISITSTTGTNNKIVITSFQTGGVNSTLSFNLQLKLVTTGGTYSPVSLQSVISGLPAVIGTTDLSNDPTTVAPDDPAIVDFCPNITLPVKLLSFSGVYRNNNTLLKWVAENQINISSYIIERSSDGINFSSVGSNPAQNAGTERLTYQYADNLSSTQGDIFYYRLKMTDIDGQFKYSNVILIRKDQKQLSGINITPNPLVSGNMVTVRFQSVKSGTANFTVVDMSGKMILKQQNSIAEGNNSFSINNLGQLQPATYLLMMNDGEQVLTTKFSIIK